MPKLTGLLRFTAYIAKPSNLSVLRETFTPEGNGKFPPIYKCTLVHPTVAWRLKVFLQRSEFL